MICLVSVIWLKYSSERLVAPGFLRTSKELTRNVMDTQMVIDTALAANATTLGQGEALQIFRQTIKNSLNINHAQKQALKMMCDFLLFMAGTMVTNDHPVLVAVRDLCRDIYEQQFQINTSTERALVVGSSAKEIRKYSSNSHMHYYVYGGETKDYDRVLRPALNDICNALHRKASKWNQQIFLPPEAQIDTSNLRLFVKRYFEMKQVLQDCMEVHRMPATIHTDWISCNTLLFEDSIYNFSAHDLLDAFSRTGVQIAYDSAVLPMFDDLPENNINSFTKNGNDGVLTFKFEFCNGYRHTLSTWRVILAHPVISGKDFSLVVEITRIGPLSVFKIMRTTVTKGVMRPVVLKHHERFVRVLDIMASINKCTGKTNMPLKYFSVRESEFGETFNYMTTLDV